MVAELTPSAMAPSAVRTRKCPVCRVPVPPLINRQRSRASAASVGFPTTWPEISSMESQPTTTSASCGSVEAATSRALARARAWTCSAAVGAARPASRRRRISSPSTASSSTSETRTNGSTPAARRVAKRPDDFEARRITSPDYTGR